MERNWDIIFDELKERGCFRSDAQLAHYLGLTRAQISAWRCGKTKLGTLTKIKMLDALVQDSLRSMMPNLFPERGRDNAMELHRALVARVTSKENMSERAIERPGDESATNLLLARLPATARERITPHLSTVSLPLGEVLYGIWSSPMAPTGASYPWVSRRGVCTWG
ncbi:cyclic nucleotide-binding protein [Caballeronia arationis]|uniref:hypothetical protein n=1 Tax=Caballeronia arationis TaxID=1777142 RepID=UPI00074CE867|nr:hypothetical protein [Caballeronia arationis]SAL06284.1 cyclic nucleotide-binding protein [Caballeronia arationis]